MELSFWIHCDVLIICCFVACRSAVRSRFHVPNARNDISKSYCCATARTRLLYVRTYVVAFEVTARSTLRRFRNESVPSAFSMISQLTKIDDEARGEGYYVGLCFMSALIANMLS